MKKIVGIALSLVMLLTLTACGNIDASEGQKESSNPAAVHSEGNQGTVQESEMREQSGMQQGEVKQDEAGQEMSQQEISGQETVQAKESDGSGTVSAEELEKDMDTKTLVVYFSCTGTTKPLAEYAAEILKADLYEIVPEEPYTEADLAYYTNGRADREQEDLDSRPAISGGVDNMDQYETIVIGYPIWHGQAPRIISTFLESYDFAGKTIVPFCTSHSSGIGSSASSLHTLCPDSTVWSEGRRFEAGTSKDAIAEWLGSVGIK